MLYINIAEKSRRLSFYLAAEEFVARKDFADDCFFIWQVDKSVIFGRNQLIENEVNLDYCRQNGILMYRRKSGGGCVYSDYGNLMLSYITRERNANFTFYRYLNFLVLALKKMGVEAQVTGRNDVMIGQKKVSGNAFYYSAGKSIVHGTLLYDTQMEHMLNAITPPTEKLQSKGVESVRNHIALLKDYTQLDLEGIKRSLRETLCTDEITLSESDEEEIREIEKQYLTDGFIYGHNPRYTLRKNGRIENVGQFDIRLEMKNGQIRDINLLGDFFITGDLDKGIAEPLRNTALDADSIERALPEDLSGIIMNLKRTDLIKLLIN